MVNVKRIHIHYVDFDEKSKVKIIRPTDPTSTLEIKKDIAEFLRRIKGSTEYYYVVFEIETRGKSNFRTVIGKTFLHA